jgi:hypothetical protein
MVGLSTIEEPGLQYENESESPVKGTATINKIATVFITLRFITFNSIDYIFLFPDFGVI